MSAASSGIWPDELTAHVRLRLSESLQSFVRVLLLVRVDRLVVGIVHLVVVIPLVAFQAAWGRQQRDPFEECRPWIALRLPLPNRL